MVASILESDTLNPLTDFIKNNVNAWFFILKTCLRRFIFNPSLWPNPDKTHHRSLGLGIIKWHNYFVNKYRLTFTIMIAFNRWCNLLTVSLTFTKEKGVWYSMPPAAPPPHPAGYRRERRMKENGGREGMRNHLRLLFLLLQPHILNHPFHIFIGIH